MRQQAIFDASLRSNRPGRIIRICPYNYLENAVSKSFVTITTDVARAMDSLRREIPETMQGFQRRSQGALKTGALGELEKNSSPWPLALPAVATPHRLSRQGAHPPQG